MGIDLGPTNTTNTIHRFPTRRAAELVMDKMLPLTDTRLAVLHDPPSESDKERGVGEYVIVCVLKRGSTMRCDESYRLGRCADLALSLALADALGATWPAHPLLKVWHLQKENRDKLSKYYLER